MKHSIPTLFLSLITLLLFSGSPVFGAIGEEYPADASGLPHPCENVYALIVGVEDYSNTNDTILNLSFAIDDARSLADLLSKRFGYHTTVLENPTKDEIFAEIDRLHAQVSPEDGLLFFFAGHGVSQPTDQINGKKIGYFIPRMGEDLNTLTLEDVRDSILESDAFVAPKKPSPTKDNPVQTDEEHQKTVAKAKAAWAAECIVQEHDHRVHDGSLRMDLLREKLFESNAKHVLAIFDSCHAGLSTRSTGLSFLNKPSQEVALINNYTLMNKGSNYVLTAGTGREKALEHQGATRGYAERAGEPTLFPNGKAIPHGVFTYELLSVLQSIPPEGATVSSVHNAVRFRVRDVLTGMSMSRSMTPQLRPFKDKWGEFVFVPKPADDWLDRVSDAVKIRISKSSGGGVERGLTGSEALDSLFAKDAKSVERQRDMNRLRSKALAVLAFQEGIKPKSDRSSNQSKDIIWTKRFEIATDQSSSGDPDAMAALYYMYKYGLGVERDDRQARHWAAEAASSDSGDAHQAWVDALKAGVGFEGTAGQEEREQALKAAEERQQASEKTAATKAAASVLLITKGDKKATGLAVIGTEILIYAKRIKDKPDDSIEASIAGMSKDIGTLRDLIEQVRIAGKVDMEEVKIAISSIQGWQRNIIQQARDLSNGARGRDRVQSMIMKSAKDLVIALEDLSKPMSRKRYAPSREEFAKAELAYAQLIAIMPYQMNNVPW